MTTTISDGTSTFTPVSVSGYEADQATGNVFHSIIGVAARAVTLRPSGLRTGTITAVMGQSFSLAQGLQTMLNAGAMFTLADTVLGGIGMTFALSGKASIALDGDSSSVWVVAFDFEEIGT